MKVCVDAGHGGKDPGAVEKVNGVWYKEKNYNLQIALALKPILEASDHQVVLTRSTDVFIYPGARLRFALAQEAQVFVSIHCNASDNPQAHGMEVLYRDEENDKFLADPIYVSLLATFPELTGRGEKDDEVDLGRRLAVFGDFLLPACLVEVGFLSNEGDLNVIQRSEDVARAIAGGFFEYCRVSMPKEGQHG